jgi:hypothetical protein
MHLQQNIAAPHKFTVHVDLREKTTKLTVHFIWWYSVSVMDNL